MEIDDSGIWNTPYAIPDGNSTDRFPFMQPWTGDTPQKGNLNSDDTLTPARTPRSRSDSQPAAHTTTQPMSAVTDASHPSTLS